VFVNFLYLLAYVYVKTVVLFPLCSRTVEYVVCDVL